MEGNSSSAHQLHGLSEQERIAESERNNQAIYTAFLDNQDNQSVNPNGIDGNDGAWNDTTITQSFQQTFSNSSNGRSYDIQSYDNQQYQFQNYLNNPSSSANDAIDNAYPTSPRSFSGSPLFGQSINTPWQSSPGTMPSPSLPSLNDYFSPWTITQSNNQSTNQSVIQPSTPSSDRQTSNPMLEQNQNTLPVIPPIQPPHTQPLVRRRLASSGQRSQAPYSVQMPLHQLDQSAINQQQMSGSSSSSSGQSNPSLPSFTQSLYGSMHSSPPAMQSPSMVSVSSMSSTNSTSVLNNQSNRFIPTGSHSSNSMNMRNQSHNNQQISQWPGQSNNQQQRQSMFQDDCHYKFTEHEVLAERYEVLRVLGRGTFAQALLCRDLLADLLAAYEDDHPPANEQGGAPVKPPRRAVQVAVKVVRNVERYRQAAQREIQVLKHLTQRRIACAPDSRQARGAEGCIPFLGSFMLPTGHTCMVFPVLNQSLYDFLRFHQFRPLMAAHVRHIAFQLLVACAYLHDECGIIHGDIKPENVLFVDSSYASVKIADIDVDVPYNTAVRLIDFGTAVFVNQRDMPAIVASRAYRSVEVVLGTGWSTGVDSWAIGCLLMEIYTGHRLFDIGQGTDADHLNAMAAILGPIPAHIKNKPRVYPPQSDQAHQAVLGAFPPELRRIPLHERIVPGDWYFYDLVSRLLAYDTNERVTAQQALQHPYFTMTPDYSL